MGMVIFGKGSQDHGGTSIAPTMFSQWHNYVYNIVWLYDQLLWVVYNIVRLYIQGNNLTSSWPNNYVYTIVHGNNSTL